MTKKPRSFHEGANTERTAVLAYIRRLLRKSPPPVDYQALLTQVEQWIRARSERYRKRPGGL